MNLVRHVAIIMDGNGRWAEMRGLPRWKGHEMGAHAVRRATEAACRNEIAVLTLFAFSTENWKRPAKEINILFSLFRSYLRSERSSLVENGIRLSAFGRRDRLSPAVLEDLAETEEATRRGERLHLRLALDYGARYEIVEAARALVRESARGSLRAEQIDEERFLRALMPERVPDPDLLIRTAGERRLSNFLLWQAAYSELYFCPRLWPDFEESDLEQALADYHSRTRKFGALPAATGTIG
jgi:undecaprenyl diphosphate synthase